ncbi:MAG TPA: tetratricopeptide repeat protein [Planktothrix sp.]|jgi:tetratricopeptide (TPR) repeat protein
MNFPHVDPMVAGTIVISIMLILFYAKVSRSNTVDERKADDFLQQAHAARQRGEHDQQEYLLKKALEMYESGVATDCTKRSSAMVHLADVLSRRGNPTEARKVTEKLLAYWQSIVDRGDADRLTDIDYFVATADFGAATYEVCEFYGKLVERKKQLFGNIHDEVANSMVLHSRLMLKLGEKQKAADIEAMANEMRAQLGTMRPPSQG